MFVFLLAAAAAQAPPAANDGVSPGAVPASVFSDIDYPASALRSEEQGLVGYRLAVDAGGRVTGCFITRSSGSSGLDAATCRILRQRAVFQPGRDANGNPATNNVSGRITWRLSDHPRTTRLDDIDPPGIVAAAYPYEARHNGEEGTVGFRVRRDADGRAHDCQVTQSSGSASLDEEACRFSESYRFSPDPDADGNTVEQVIERRLTWDDGEAETAARRARPTVPLASLVTIDDYPAEARSVRGTANVAFRLVVGPDGFVIECFGITGPDEPLEAAACRLMRERARFTPALDAGGNPVADNHWGHIVWRLPETPETKPPGHSAFDTSLPRPPPTPSDK